MCITEVSPPKSIHIALDKIPEECKELLTAYLEKCYDKFWSKD